MDLYPHPGDEDAFKPSPQIKPQERPAKKTMKAKKSPGKEIKPKIRSVITVLKNTII